MNQNKTASSLKTRFDFPVGYFSFCKEKGMNYQLNRWHSLGYWTKEESSRAGANLRGLEDWKSELLSLAEWMTEEDRDLATAITIRAAEFFTHPSDPDKIPLYDRFYEAFYAAVRDEPMEKHFISYQTGSLPALRFPAENSPGTIIIHGGLDSFMEEFFSVAWYLAEAGYEVILFDGPGQGAAMRRSDLYMTHKWEEPVTAVLDYFDLSDVTLIGLSLGGYLALRAAAFEERITRVIAFDVFHYDQHGSGLQGAIYRLFLRYPGLYDWVAQTAMKRSISANHVISQWMFITGVKTPAEWNALIEHYSVSDIAPLVRQDVLLLAGEKDHMIPLKEYHKNMNGLRNARSVTGRIFTTEEQAQNHCQVGNLRLALDVICHWIEQKS